MLNVRFCCYFNLLDGVSENVQKNIKMPVRETERRGDLYMGLSCGFIGEIPLINPPVFHFHTKRTNYTNNLW